MSVYKVIRKVLVKDDGTMIQSSTGQVLIPSPTSPIFETIILTDLTDGYIPTNTAAGFIDGPALVDVNNAITLSHDAITLDANADTLLSLSTQELGLDTQAANLALMGPTSGAAAVPTFRELIAKDVNTPVVTHTSNVILTLADMRAIHIFDVDAAGTDLTATLPSVAAANVGDWIILVRVGTGNTLFISTVDTDTILDSSAGGVIECSDATYDLSTFSPWLITATRWGAGPGCFGIWNTH